MVARIHTARRGEACLRYTWIRSAGSMMRHSRGQGRRCGAASAFLLESLPASRIEFCFQHRQHAQQRTRLLHLTSRSQTFWMCQACWASCCLLWPVRCQPMCISHSVDPSGTSHSWKPLLSSTGCVPQALLSCVPDMLAAHRGPAMLASSVLQLPSNACMHACSGKAAAAALLAWHQPVFHAT